jgi:hypothetical protein
MAENIRAQVRKLGYELHTFPTVESGWQIQLAVTPMNRPGKWQYFDSLKEVEEWAEATRAAQPFHF